MREIVIVIRDLYLEPEPGQGVGAAPGIEHVARFGDKATLRVGWRAWVAHWLGLPQYAREMPASVAAAALVDAPTDGAVWLVTPMHLIAGLTSLHFDRRSVLRLSGAELEELAVSFRDTFRGSGFELRPLAGGELLLSGPLLSAPSTTTEPARMLLTSVAEAFVAGQSAPALRRLSAEMEMWLHDHPINEARGRRGAPPVATLWVWGGGAAAISRPTASREIADAAFGSDAYVGGLWRLAGGESRPMPVDWAAVIGEPRAQRALGVVEVAELLHANASWLLADAVAEIDRRLISPSLAALRRGEIDQLVVLANDRRLSVRAADRWRLWRRMRAVRSGFESLA
ncbi:MAG TPA: hypothetical protein VGT07_04470 [Steroidobacteraceae bacterium]|nr:hypothetical protein [Steroidobacteraceae bacterium]